MGVTSAAITNAARINMAKALINQNDSSYDYVCMGVGNGDTPASANDSELTGSETKYVTVNGEYEDDYKAMWTHTWQYNDLSGHVFREVGIFKNESERSGNMLCRVVFDAITLNESDYLETTIRVRFP